MTQSPSCTCPASAVQFDMMHWLPTMQSWATCEYAMNRQSLPILVTPRPPTVPRLMVQNSRNTLRSPTSSRVGSPAYLRSCGASPIEANWNTRVSRPSVVGPLTTAWEPIQLPAPMRTPAPITANGPTSTLGSTSAPGSTIARGIDQALTSGATIIVAEVATAPSTSATVSNFQMPRMARSSVALRTSRSPGTTGRLKRALSMPTK